MNRWRIMLDALLGRSIERRYIGCVQKRIHWTDLNRHETITFLLFEDKHGRRSFKVHSHGFCKLYETHERHNLEIIKWANGGPLPSNLQRNSESGRLLHLVK